MELSLPLLEAAYYRLSLKLHPDCHPHADLKTRLQVLEQTAHLNEAYATLSNPQRRALYLLKIYGVDLDDKAKPFQAPPDFLNRLLELREQFQQAALARQVDILQSLEHLAKEAMEKAFELGCQCLRDYLKNGKYETPPVAPSSPPLPPEKLQQAAAHLVCLRYWQRFLADIEYSQEELSS